jgi:hypothetical protein
MHPRPRRRCSAVALPVLAAATVAVALPIARRGAAGRKSWRGAPRPCGGGRGGTGNRDAADEHDGGGSDQGAGEPVPAGAGSEPDVHVGAGGVGGGTDHQGRAELLRGAAVGHADAVQLRRDAVLPHRAVHCAHRLRCALPRRQRRALPCVSWFYSNSYVRRHGRQASRRNAGRGELALATLYCSKEHDAEVRL